MLSLETAYYADSDSVLAALGGTLPADIRARAQQRAERLVDRLRHETRPGLMEVFLAEYGLSTDEGVALMCLAEALLRVPDEETIDALIEDKIAPSEWGAHLGKSSSSLVNASTWGLMLTGRVLDTDDSRGMAGTLRGLVKRMGEPVIRAAVARAIKEMGRQFVLGQTLSEALRRTKRPYTYSYDMLGEAAMTARDAERYFLAYHDAILTLGPHCETDDIRRNPGISIKLSALHPRYDELQRDRVMAELVPRVRELAVLAAERGMGLNIDAEEADRLRLSLDIFEAVIGDPALSDWDGLGMVIQAYGKRVQPTLVRVAELAEAAGERCMVRLVKGAYWDTEIKRAQVAGVEGFPVFTRKSETDAAYLLAARHLLERVGRIYPQFATHNAHSAATILEMVEAQGVGRGDFEFQRLHGMGEGLHDILVREEAVACRIYAPVGAHRDLLAYLVRRLLENGANSSFVAQVLDKDVPIEAVVEDPFTRLDGEASFTLRQPSELFGERANSEGVDLRNRSEQAAFLSAREAWAAHQWEARPLTVSDVTTRQDVVRNPARPSDEVGQVWEVDEAEAQTLVGDAKLWDAPVTERAEVLRRAADSLEDHSAEIFALLAREAGKGALDAIAELREAVDFLRYYADEAERREGAEPAGIVVAISPWNFPLAIFVGQIAAALAMGNAVIAKPAETTPLIAIRATQWLHEAGVPLSALQCVPGQGRTLGAALTKTAGVAGVVFTGSTRTAQSINRTMAEHLSPEAFLIAETGGINAMIVDSTALPEQAVRDIVASAFQSAGQRCSALRCLYVQDDIAEDVLEMLEGAMDELRIGDPWELSTDVGPVINRAAQKDQLDYIGANTVRHQTSMRERLNGTFVPPTLIEVKGISDVTREVFGPVLHVAQFDGEAMEAVIEDINATGFGLTFGLHSRIDDRVEMMASEIDAGNIYVNRNQIGAVVGSQPFGGEGLSGTGPKAGGPHYLDRFGKPDRVVMDHGSDTQVSADEAQARIDAAPLASDQSFSILTLPGPTGESNRLHAQARGRVLCLGPGEAAMAEQAAIAARFGCPAVEMAVAPDTLSELDGFSAVMFWGSDDEARAFRQALAAREGPILPLILGREVGSQLTHETHVCIDTTAAGGNASLLAAVSETPDI